MKVEYISKSKENNYLKCRHGTLRFVLFLTGFYVVIRQGAAVSSSSRYVLTEVSSSEAGVYECVADNGVGDPARRQVTVTVLC